MAEKILVEVISKAGVNEGFHKAKLGTDGLATVKRGDTRQTFKVLEDSYIRHRRKRRDYVRWRQGQPTSEPRTSEGQPPIPTDVELDMIARNTFARDAYEASKGRNLAAKMQTIVLWALVGVLVLGFFFLASRLDGVTEAVGRLAPTTSPVGP